MYEYELQQLRSAELIRRAEQERLARRAVLDERAARREEAARRRARSAYRPPTSAPVRPHRVSAGAGTGGRTTPPVPCAPGPPKCRRRGTRGCRICRLRVPDRRIRRVRGPDRRNRRGRVPGVCPGESTCPMTDLSKTGAALSDPLCDARPRGDQVRQSRVRRPRRRTGHAQQRARPCRPRASRRRCCSAARRGSARPGSSRSSRRRVPPRAPSSRSAAASRSVPTDCRSPPSPPLCAPCAALLPDEFVAAAAGQEERAGPAAARTRRDRTRGRHDEEGMARLFELTARLLERVAADRTVVVVLEDLHWADASTRHLLSYLFRTLRTRPPRRRRHLPRRRRPPPPPTAPAPRRTRPAAHRRPRRTRPLQPRRGRPPGRRHPRRRTRTGPGRRHLRTLRRQRLLRRGTRRRRPARAAVPASPTRCATCSSYASRDCPTTPSGSPGSSPRAAPPSSTALLAAVARLAEDELDRGPAGRRRRQHPARRAQTATATASVTRWSARPSATTCCPANAPALNRRYAEALEADPSLVRADERVTRLASYWYHAHDAAKALPAVLDASVEARRRHAYSEQLAAAGTGDGAVGRRPRGRPRATCARSTTPRSIRPAAATRRPPRCAIST